MGDKNLTWAENVRHIARAHGITGLTEDDIDVALWERTAFPLAGRAEVERQLDELFSSPDVKQALLDRA